MRAPLRASTSWYSVVAVLAAVLVTAAMAGPASAHGGHDHEQGADLAELRMATVAFHSIDAVEQAGYQLGYIPPFLLDTCIAHPTAGAMGFHWFTTTRSMTRRSIPTARRPSSTPLATTDHFGWPPSNGWCPRVSGKPSTVSVPHPQR